VSSPNGRISGDVDKVFVQATHNFNYGTQEYVATLFLIKFGRCAATNSQLPGMRSNPQLLRPSFKGSWKGWGALTHPIPSPNTLQVGKGWGGLTSNVLGEGEP